MDGWMDGWIIGGVSSSSSAVSVTLGFSMFGDDDDDDDDGNDISCMYVSVHMCGSVCDSVSVVALDTHHPHGHHHDHHHHDLFSRRLSHSFNSFIHSFNVMSVSLTSISIP